jgi:ElaB/YqjD/DUF883 family membrane-anchored ribosome-binding protein
LFGLTFGLQAVPAAGEPRAKKTAEPKPDPMAEVQNLKAELEQRLTEQEAAAKQREEAIRKEATAAIEAARDEADKRIAADRNERQADILRLQKAMDEAAQHEDARERNTPPSVGAAAPGVSLYGYVQADYQIRQSSEDQLDASGQPFNQDRFLIRRARLGVIMDRRYGEGRIEVDGNTVNGPAFGLTGAEASLKLPGSGDGAPPVVRGTMGLFRIPFGGEVPQDDRYRLFMERSTAARALFPGEADLGARLSGGWHFIRYALAVMNGQPLGGSAFAGLDPNHQKDILGRLGVEQSLERVAFSGGFSALRGTGFHSGAQATKPMLQWNDSNEDGSLGANEIVGLAGLAATQSSNYTRTAFGADLSVSARFSPMLRTSLAAEFYLASDLDRAILPADPKSVLGRDLRELGYYVSLIQEYGRWRLGLRYDYYDPDQDANKMLNRSPVPTNASYASMAVVAGCTATWGRLLVEYDYNRNHLGLDLKGMPTNLADNALFVRGEVTF